MLAATNRKPPQEPATSSSPASSPASSPWSPHDAPLHRAEPRRGGHHGDPRRPRLAHPLGRRGTVRRRGHPRPHHRARGRPRPPPPRFPGPPQPRRLAPGARPRRRRHPPRPHRHDPGSRQPRGPPPPHRGRPRHREGPGHRPGRAAHPPRRRLGSPRGQRLPRGGAAQAPGPALHLHPRRRPLRQRPPLGGHRAQAAGRPRAPGVRREPHQLQAPAERRPPALRVQRAAHRLQRDGEQGRVADGGLGPLLRVEAGGARGRGAAGLAGSPAPGHVRQAPPARPGARTSRSSRSTRAGSPRSSRRTTSSSGSTTPSGPRWRRKAEGHGRAGVFWQTQGSGKSYSMVFYAQKILRTLPGNWTLRRRHRPGGAGRPDRQDLRRLRRRGGRRTKCHATSGAHLRKLLRGEPPLRLHPDPQVPEHRRCSCDRPRRDGHRRRGPPLPVRDAGHEHAGRAAERALRGLHRHAAHRRRGAHARGVRRVRVHLRLPAVDGGQRHRPPLLREPHPRAAPGQPRPGRRALPGDRRGRARRRDRGPPPEAPGHALRPHHPGRPPRHHRRRHRAALPRPRVPGQGDGGLDRQGDGAPHLREGGARVEGRDRAGGGGSPRPRARRGGAGAPRGAPAPPRRGGHGAHRLARPERDRGDEGRSASTSFPTASGWSSRSRPWTSASRTRQTRSRSSSSAPCGSPASTRRAARPSTSTSPCATTR